MFCIRQEGQARMLCGKFAGFVPVAQPAHPQWVHDVCLERMYRREKPTPPRPKPGVCPACEGLVRVEGGKVQPHGVFRMRGGEMVEGDEPCLGVNMAPVRGVR